MSENKRKKFDISTRKPMRIMFRVAVLVVLFCVVIFGGIIISDVFFNRGDSEPVPEIIAVTVSGDTIILNDDRTVTLDELKAYLDDADSKGDLVTVALINDTGSPAEVKLYNQIVRLLADYEIYCEEMTETATPDEIGSMGESLASVS